MKDFFKYMLATICGIVAMGIFAGIIFMISFASMIASGSATPEVKDNSVLVIKMSGTVNEQAEEGTPFDALLGAADMENLGLDNIVKAIELAKNNDHIKGIYLEGGTTSFDTPATAQQVRDALEDFKKSGKWIIAYSDNYLQANYYVATAADSIFLNKTGVIDFKGLGGKSYYLTGLFEKVGVRYQCTRVGKYKSAVESMTRKDMSENDREQRLTLYQGIWNHWLKEMAKSRKVTEAQLNQLADDSIMVFANVDDYKTAKLVDDTMYPEAIKALIKNKLGIDSDEEINQVSISEMLDQDDDKDEADAKVAVYYAFGEIVDQPLTGLSSDHAIVGSEVVEDLKKLADDENVKAVVLRVNSPGGSAIASEQIWHAVKLLKAKKPVVVSMGGYAASGGYMISAAANYIYAEPTTITGSIGIFGLLPNFNELVTDKLGVTWDGVQTNKHTDYDTNLMFGKNTDEELRFLQAYVDRGYDTFLSIVAEGRKMKKEEVHEIAQGRVWLATDALPIKLVDKLGSLNDAVKKAAELAKVEEYSTASYPQKASWFESLLNSATGSKDTYLDEQMRETLGELYEPIMDMRKDCKRNRLQARLPFATTIR